MILSSSSSTSWSHVSKIIAGFVVLPLVASLLREFSEIKLRINSKKLRLTVLLNNQYTTVCFTTHEVASQPSIRSCL
ncbi:hypothetical protein F4781DRAFT_401195 [Annulohypoxylon bovei var. microspora]|nr:hypothetical protein F4781DRAFT_401195 [Annulohypoxylon bovei var. microspora]